MKIVFKNLLEVNENDTVGDAIIKSMTGGFVKGTLTAGIGLGVAVVLIKTVSKKGSSKKKEEKNTEEEIEKQFDDLQQRAIKFNTRATEELENTFR